MSVRSNGWSNEWLMIELSSLYGDEGSFFCLFGKKHKKDTGGNSMKNMVDIVYGLGGRDVATGDIARVFDHLFLLVNNGGKGPKYIHMGQRSSAPEVF